MSFYLKMYVGVFLSACLSSYHVVAREARNGHPIYGARATDGYLRATVLVPGIKPGSSAGAARILKTAQPPMQCVNGCFQTVLKWVLVTHLHYSIGIPDGVCYTTFRQSIVSLPRFGVRKKGHKSMLGY